MELLTSRKNPLIAHVRKLVSSGAYRQETGAFVCDGRKLFGEALQYGGILRTVICTPETELPALPDGVRAVSVPADILCSLSPSKTPQGVLCVCAIPERPLPRVLDGRRYLVLDAVQDPGNVGTILRTADAFGADGVFLLPGCASLWNPKTVRATMGALFRVPTWDAAPEEVSALLRASGLPLYGAALRPDAADIREVSLSRFAAAIGSEGGGLSEAVLSLCDGVFKIPMRARCESLNAAIAAAVALWESARGDASII